MEPYGDIIYSGNYCNYYLASPHGGMPISAMSGGALALTHSPIPRYQYELCPVLRPMTPIALYEPCSVLLRVRVGHPLIRYSLARLSAMLM